MKPKPTAGWGERFNEEWEKLAENLGSSVTSGDLREFSESFIRTELERQEKELVKKCDYAMREHAGELVKNVDKEVLRQVKAQKTELLSRLPIEKEAIKYKRVNNSLGMELADEFVDNKHGYNRAKDELIAFKKKEEK